MALIGIVNLADRLVTQSQPRTGQSAADSPPAAAPGSSTSKSSAVPDASATTADEFTLSTQTPAAGATAQAAGLFSVATFSLFTAAAKFLLGNTGNGSPTAPVPGPAVTTGASATTSGTPALALIAPSGVAQSASVNSELQSLNTALSALGLPPSDIAVIDRIAALLKDFSPAAYSDLLRQFETLAQSQLAPSASTPPSATAATATGSASASAAQPSSLPTNLSIAIPASVSSPPVSSVPKENRATGATFRVQGLVIRFASVSETQTSNTSRTPGSPQSATNLKTTSRDKSASASEVNLVYLGVEEISVTLNNSLGQRAHVHVAQSGSKRNSTSGAPDSGTFLAKSANA
jgi:hypothetical protein